MRNVALLEKAVLHQGLGWMREERGRAEHTAPGCFFRKRFGFGASADSLGSAHPPASPLHPSREAVAPTSRASRPSSRDTTGNLQVGSGPSPALLFPEPHLHPSPP